jgi:low affinity Fe/Cu permease
MSPPQIRPAAPPCAREADRVDIIQPASCFRVMVFCVQHTQNKDASAMQLKLDELVRALDGARNTIAGIETDADLINTERADAVELAAATKGASAGATGA